MSFDLRIIGDWLHIMSFVSLIIQIKKTRHLKGLSYRTQEIYLVVFITRYMDTFIEWYSVYNLTLRVLFIGFTLFLIYQMKFKKPLSLTYDYQNDSLNHYTYIYVPCAIMTLIINIDFTFFDLFYSYSIWLEAYAILPQLYMLNRNAQGNVENFTVHYIVLLGLYRIFYLIQWAFSYIIWTSFIGGIVQTILYCDFFYYYFNSLRNNTGFTMSV